MAPTIDLPYSASSHIIKHRSSGPDHRSSMRSGGSGKLCPEQQKQQQSNSSPKTASQTTTSSGSRTPAQDRLQRLQRTIKDAQDTAQQRRGAAISSTPSAVSTSRKRVATSTLASVFASTSTSSSSSSNGSNYSNSSNSSNSILSPSPLSKRIALAARSKTTSSKSAAAAPAALPSAPIIKPSAAKLSPTTRNSAAEIRHRRSAAASDRTPANNRLAALRQQLVEQQRHDSQQHLHQDVQMGDDEDAVGPAVSPIDSDGSPMDWDECMLQAGANSQQAPAGCRVIVLDTNVLIDQLTLIRSVMLQQLKPSATATPPTQFFVPRIVLLELDALKQRRDERLGRGAQRAIRLVHEALSAGDWRLQAERSQTPRPGTEGRSNDERILDCALRLRAERGVSVLRPTAGGSAVCLLTNDVNLRNFAMIEGMEAKSVAEFVARS